MQNKNKKGFTLVELIVVIAIIGILAAVLIPTFSGAIDSANRGAVESTASTYKTAYLSLSLEKGTTYTAATEQANSPVAPFTAADVAKYTSSTEDPNLYLVADKTVAVGSKIIGFIYWDASRGYYSYYVSATEKFETAATSTVASETQNTAGNVDDAIEDFFGPEAVRIKTSA